MPQLNQLAEVALSQFFWLLLVLGLIYFGIGKAMLPKIQSTVDLREKRIADDLAAAEAARAAADESEAAYRERMDASRAEAAKVTAQAKDDSARATEKKLAKADDGDRRQDRQGRGEDPRRPRRCGQGDRGPRRRAGPRDHRQGRRASRSARPTPPSAVKAEMANA